MSESIDRSSNLVAANQQLIEESVNDKSDDRYCLFIRFLIRICGFIKNIVCCGFLLSREVSIDKRDVTKSKAELTSTIQNVEKPVIECSDPLQSNNYFCREVIIDKRDVTKSKAELTSTIQNVEKSVIEGSDPLKSNNDSKLVSDTLHPQSSKGCDKMEPNVLEYDTENLKDSRSISTPGNRPIENTKVIKKKEEKKAEPSSLTQCSESSINSSSTKSALSLNKHSFRQETDPILPTPVARKISPKIVGSDNEGLGGNENSTMDGSTLSNFEEKKKKIVDLLKKHNEHVVYDKKEVNRKNVDRKRDNTVEHRSDTPSSIDVINSDTIPKRPPRPNHNKKKEIGVGTLLNEHDEHIVYDNKVLYRKEVEREMENTVEHLSNTQNSIEVINSDADPIPPPRPKHDKKKKSMDEGKGDLAVMSSSVESGASTVRNIEDNKERILTHSIERSYYKRKEVGRNEGNEKTSDSLEHLDEIKSDKKRENKKRNLSAVASNVKSKFKVFTSFVGNTKRRLTNEPRSSNIKSDKNKNSKSDAKSKISMVISEKPTYYSYDELESDYSMWKPRKEDSGLPYENHVYSPAAGPNVPMVVVEESTCYYDDEQASNNSGQGRQVCSPPLASPFAQVHSNIHCAPVSNPVVSVDESGYDAEGEDLLLLSSEQDINSIHNVTIDKISKRRNTRDEEIERIISIYPMETSV